MLNKNIIANHNLYNKTKSLLNKMNDIQKDNIKNLISYFPDVVKESIYEFDPEEDYFDILIVDKGDEFNIQPIKTSYRDYYKLKINKKGFDEFCIGFELERLFLVDDYYFTYDVIYTDDNCKYCFLFLILYKDYLSREIKLDLYKNYK